MVNRDNGKKFKKTFDGHSTTKEFTACAKKIETIFYETQRKRHEITLCDESNAPDALEIRKGFCPSIKYQSQKMDVVLDIEMSENPQPNTHKIASELAIVLDISGSMSGEPLQYSKQAIIEVVNSLTKNDYLHFITYSNLSKIEFTGFMTEENKRQAKISIMKVSTAGCTNMVNGIETALESMFGESVGECQDRPGSLRIFLFTDGVVNRGVSNLLEIGEIVKLIHSNFGINLTTFGFGSKFDETLMRLVAAEGKGDYFYIDGVSDLHYKVSKGLEVLQSLFAINANIYFFGVDNPSKNVKVVIENVHGFEIIPGIASQISLGDLCFDDLRQVLLSLSIVVPAGTILTEESSDPIEVLQFTLSYLALESNGGYSEKQHNGSVSIEFSNDRNKLNQIPDSLKVAKTLQHANLTDKKILKLIQESDFETARSLANKNLELLKSILNIDKTGVVIHLIARAESTIKKMVNMEESLEKDIDYTAYQGSVIHRKCF